MQNEYDDYEDYESPPFRWMSVGVLLLAVVGFFSLAWYAYYTGTKEVDYQEVATIEADKSPIKVAPEQPGGTEFPHQEKTIYDAPEAADTSVDNAALMKEAEKPVVPADMPEKSEPAPETKVAAIIQKAVIDTQNEATDAEDEAEAPTEKADSIHVSTIDPKTDIKDAKKAASKAADKAAAAKPKAVIKIEKMGKPEPVAKAAVADTTHVLKPIPDPFANGGAAKSADVAAKEDKKLEIVKPVPFKAEPEQAIPVPAEDKPEISVVEAEQKPTVEIQKPALKAEIPAQAPAPESTPQPTPAAPAQAGGDGGQHQLQMGAFRSNAEAEDHWTKLGKNNAALVKDHGYKIVRSDLGEKGVYYRLRMVGFDSAAQAKALCDQLKTNKQSCFYTKP